MFKAISGALSIMLIIVVLKVALPEIALLVTEIIVKILTVVNNSIDLTTSSAIL